MSCKGLIRSLITAQCRKGIRSVLPQQRAPLILLPSSGNLLGWEMMLKCQKLQFHPWPLETYFKWELITVDLTSSMFREKINMFTAWTWPLWLTGRCWLTMRTSCFTCSTFLPVLGDLFNYDFEWGLKKRNRNQIPHLTPGASNYTFTFRWHACVSV